MPYIGSVYIDVITEIGVNESSSTTDHALEDGEQITDHVNSNPITISLKGILLDESESKVLQLRKSREKGEILTYNYMTSLTKVVITDFSRDYSAKIKDGYAFTMSLKQIKVTKVAGAASMSPSTKRQVAPVSNQGRQQTQTRTR